MNDSHANDAGQKREVRRTTVILTIIALAFYAGFILLGVVRA